MKLLFVVVLALVATVSAQGEAEVATPAATPVDLTPVTQKLEQVQSSILSEVAKSNVGDLTKSLQAQQAKLEQLQTLLSTQGESSKQLGSTLNTLTTNFNSLREELGKKQPAAPQQTSGDSDAKLKAVEKKLDSVADLLMKLADSVKQTNERVLTLSKTFDVAHDQTLSLLKNATAAQEGAFAHSMKCVTTWYTETVKPFAAVAYERAGVQFAHFSAFANEHGGVALQEARKLGNKLYKDAKVHGVAAAMKADAQLQQLLEEKVSVPRQHVQIASQAILGFTALVAAILVFYLLKFVLCAVLCCGMCRKQPRPVAPAAHEPATSNSASKKKK